MAVVRALGAVLGHDVAETRDEDGQILRIDRGVLDEGDGLGLALGAQQEAEPGLAELPDRLLLGRIEGDVPGIAEASRGAPRLESLDLALDLCRGVAGVLDDQNGRGIALDEAHALGLLDVAAGEVQDHLVGQLHGVRARLEDGLRGLERLLHVVVVDDVDGGGLGALHEAHLGLEDGDQGALGAHDDPRHVQRPVLDELVEVVAADAPPVLGVAGANLAGVLVAQPGHLAVDLAFEARGPHLGAEALGGHLAEDDPAAVAQERGQLDHVLHREPVGDRVGAAGVVAEHPADGGAVGG